MQLDNNNNINNKYGVFGNDCFLSGDTSGLQIQRLGKEIDNFGKD